MTENTSLSQRSIEYNNAGVRCIETARHSVAWDLFKGALEVKLAIERTGEAYADIRSYLRSNSYIARAEARLMNLMFVAPEEQVSPRIQNPILLGVDPSITTKRESAAIIFNLALTEHLKARCSEQAISLYELSMTLLAGDSVDLLGISLMNNIGVWCYENGDQEGCAKCISHLVSFTSALSSEMSPEVREGVQSNILWLTYPPCAASAAA